MSEPGRIRPIIALAAAYLIALQALLLPLSVAAGGALPFNLCSAHESAASPQGPTGHSTGCPCAAGCGMQCCVHALAAPPQNPILLAARGAGLRMAMTVPLFAARRPGHVLQLARGPPVA